MATGQPHRHGSARTHELAAVLEAPDVARGLATTFAIDRTKDIPYVGGVSRDGRTVYIDRHFPRRLNVGARLVDLSPGLVRHEQVEGALLRTGRYSYPAAHELATAAENLVYRAIGVDPAAAQAVYPRYIKAARAEALVDVPHDLELRPYTDAPTDLDVLRRLRLAMKGVAALPGKTIAQAIPSLRFPTRS